MAFATCPDCLRPQGWSLLPDCGRCNNRRYIYFDENKPKKMNPTETVQSLMKKHFFHFGFYRVSKWVNGEKFPKYVLITTWLLAFVVGFIAREDHAVLVRVGYYFLFFVFWGICTAIDRFVMLRTLRRIKIKYAEAHARSHMPEGSYARFNREILQTKWRWAL
jgi:hypothetical protein